MNLRGSSAFDARPVSFAATARRVGWVALGLAVVALGVWQWPRGSSVGDAELPPLRFIVAPPDGFEIADETPSFDAGGRLLAFVAESAGTRWIALRRLDAARSVALPGTQGVVFSAVLSRDGSSVYFQQALRLMRMATDGSQAPSAVPGAPALTSIRGRGFDVLDDGSLLLSADLATGVLRFDPATQRLDTLRRPNSARGEYGVLNPTAVPGGDAYVFALLTRSGYALMARTMDGAREVEVLPGGTAAAFAAGERMVYARGSDLFITDFDRATLRTRGAATPLAQGLPSNPLAGSYSPYFASAAGQLVAFVAGASRANAEILGLIDRASGRRTALRDSIGYRPRFSPDGQTIVAEDSAQIWLHDLSRGGVRTRFSQLPLNYVATFTPDGRRIVTSTYEGGPAQLWSYAVADPKDRQRLSESPKRRYVGGFSPDGRLLAFIELSGTGGYDILARRDDGTVIPLVQTTSAEHHPRFSPDGRLLAFASDETGRMEVYVQDFPATARPMRVSTEGGNAPVWDPTGRRLYFQRDEALYAVAIDGLGGGLSVGSPRRELEVAAFVPTDDVSWSYDISPDGKTFVVAQRTGTRGVREMHVLVTRRAVP